MDRLENRREGKGKATALQRQSHSCVSWGNLLWGAHRSGLKKKYTSRTCHEEPQEQQNRPPVLFTGLVPAKSKEKMMLGKLITQASIGFFALPCVVSLMIKKRFVGPGQELC